MDDFLYGFGGFNNQFFSYYTATNSPNQFYYKQHIHSLYELYYFLQGDVTYYIEGQSYVMNKHDILIINNKELHKPVFNSPSTYERVVINFAPDLLSNLNSEKYSILNIFDKRKLGMHNKIDSNLVIESNAIHLMNSIIHYTKSDLPEKDVLLYSTFLQLMVTLNNIYKDMEGLIVEPSSEDMKINKILEFLNTNLSEKITLDLLEKEFFINKYYMCHIFKRNTGFTIQEYLLKKRMLKAKELLEKGYMASEVCHLIGFGDYSNFYKSFKKVIGKSPKEFSKL